MSYANNLLQKQGTLFAQMADNQQFNFLLLFAITQKGYLKKGKGYLNIQKLPRKVT